MPRGRQPTIPEREIRELCAKISTGQLDVKQAAESAGVTPHTINAWRKKYGDRRKPRKKRIIRDSEYDAILFQGAEPRAVAEAGENRANSRYAKQGRPNGSVTLPETPRPVSVDIPELQAEVLFLREENHRLRQASVDLLFRMNGVGAEVRSAKLGLNISPPPEPELAPAAAVPKKKRRGRPRKNA